MRIHPIFRRCALLALVTSCAVGPDYKAPDVAKIAPAGWQWKIAEPKDALPKGEWWHVFNDPTLATLETNAIANNQNLRAAVARVDQARAGARLTRSQFFPELSLDPAFNRQRISGNEPLPFPVKLKPIQLSTFSVPLDMSYEVDLWGRVRRALEAVRAQAQITAADYQNILLTLTADIAVNYFLLRSLDSEITLLEQTIVLREKSAAILNTRFTAGTIPELDAVQAKGEIALVQADLADMRRRRAETLDALALLCGKTAGEFSIAPQPVSATPPLIPPGLPSAVLERRPDVAAAERNLAARNAQIGVARAAYFPVVRLTGQAGFLSGDADTLFSSDSLTWSIGPSLRLPLLTGGRTAAQVKQAEAAYQEAVATYRQTALGAFKEVEDSLAQISFWTQQSTALSDALTSSRKATQLTQARYAAGVLTEFEVTAAQRAELQQEIQMAELSARRFAATVRLIKAFGGGWDASENSQR